MIADAMWISNVPDGWKPIAFKRAIKRMATGLNPRDNFDLNPENGDDFYYVTIKNFKNGKVFLDDKCDRIDGSAWSMIQNRSDLHKGDILFASISDEGNVYVLEKEPDNWNINESVFCIRVDEKWFIPQFFAYMISNQMYYNDLRSDATGTTFLSIKQNKLKDTIILAPPLHEQKHIVSYLDSKCAAIDKAIDRHKKIIDKLEEYQEATITKVTTTGIRFHEYNKSHYGVIGDIPADWKICRLRFIGSPVNGISKGGEFFGKGYPFVSYGDVYRNISLPSQVDGLIDSTEEERQKYSVQKGDIFFTRTSETIDEVGFSSVCEETIPDAVFAGFLIRVRPNTDFLMSAFAKYYFRSKHLRNYFAREMDITTRASLSQNFLKDVPVLVPPREEQLEIANYLDEFCSAIDKSTRSHQSIIKKLEEYRKSIIYNAVTGKIDCRKEAV